MDLLPRTQKKIKYIFFFLIPVEAIKKSMRQWNNGLSYGEWVSGFHITSNICKDGLQQGGRVDLMLLPVCYWLSVRRSERWQFIQHFFLSDGLDVKEEFVHYCQLRPSLDPCPRVGYFFKQTLGEKVKQTFWSQGKISDASTSMQGEITEGSFNVVML